MIKKSIVKRNCIYMIAVVLFAFFLSLQFSLWGKHGLWGLWSLHRANAEEAMNNEQLKARNQSLIDKISEFKQGGSVLEEYARQDLGMIKPKETFFKIIKTDRITQDAPE